jgi:hypothetical protein
MTLLPPHAEERFPWFRRMATNIALPLQFAIWSAFRLWDGLTLQWIGGDGLIYHRAVTNWFNGGDPWSAYIVHPGSGHAYHFYALPPTLVVLAPFGLVPESWAGATSVIGCAIAAVYILRRLRLPWFWTIFPPLFQGVLSGNPGIPMLALLIASHPILHVLAPQLKVYGGVPLLGERRWRAVFLAAGFTLATMLVFPELWLAFLDGATAKGNRLLEEANGGFSAYQYGPVILALTAAAMVIFARFDLRAAGWLAPVALWPATQFHWATLAMPVMTPWMAFVLPLHVQGVPLLAVLIQALLTTWQRVRSRAVRSRSQGQRH